MEGVAKIFFFLGIVFLFLGVVFYFSSNFPFSKFLGKLPGDIYIEKENFRFYFPITTSILLSILLSFLLYFISRIR